MMSSLLKSTVLLLCTGVSLAASAATGATTTWVSGVGDDANPCTRTAPCKTFAGAISKTGAGGSINVLDPGGYGAVTITKSITINGGGFVGSIVNSGTVGVTVNAGLGDTVVLKNIDLNGAGISAGTYGIRYIAGGRLIVEGGVIENSATGIDVVPTSSILNLVVRDTVILGTNATTGTSDGILVESGGVGARVSLRKVSISNFINGVEVNGGALDITNSTLTQNTGVAVLANGGTVTSVSNGLTLNGNALQANSSAVISADHNTLSSNAVAVYANGGTIRLTDNTIYDNKTGISCGSGPVGTVTTTGYNRKANNVGGSLPVCATIGAINQQ